MNILNIKVDISDLKNDFTSRKKVQYITAYDELTETRAIVHLVYEDIGIATAYEIDEYIQDILDKSVMECIQKMENTANHRLRLLYLVLSEVTSTLSPEVIKTYWR